MGALVTLITDAFEPAIWSKAMLEETTELSLLIQSGIMGSDPEIDDAASQGGRIVTMPFWDDLPHDTGTTTRSKIPTETDDHIAPAGMTSDKDYAVKDFRTQNFSSGLIISRIAGDDPVKRMTGRYAKWWMKEFQRLLLLKLTGMFLASSVYTYLQNDISIATANTDQEHLIGSTAISNTRFLLGDAFQKLTGIIMHSVPYKHLCDLDLIDGVPESQQGLGFGKYMGLDVLVDDGMTVVAPRYYTYLFGPGAIAFKELPPEAGNPNMELVYDPLAATGAGTVDIVTRRYFLMHPRGVKYVDSDMSGVAPSDAELITPANWTRVYDVKNIRIARLVTNG